MSAPDQPIYDVAVVGLGPAGATLARLLGGRMRVAAVDKKRREGDGGFQKPCGGLLAPDAQKALARFGLTLPLDVLVDPQLFSVRTIDVGTGRIRHYQRFYVNLDRHRFDRWLRGLVPQGVDVWDDARCVSLARCAEGWRLVIRQDGAEHEITARRVVGADGAASLVRRTLYPDAKIRRYLSIQQWFPDTHQTPFYSCVFDPQVTDCYAWGLSKQGSFVFGGAFDPKGAREHFEALKEKLAPHGFRFGEPLRTEACLVLRPAGPGDFCCGRENAFLIGEAAGFISPSSLEGISYALDSARKLAGALTGGREPHRAYRGAVLPLRMKLVAKHLKSPFMYAPPLRNLVMASGLDSIEVEEP